MKKFKLAMCALAFGVTSSGVYAASYNGTVEFNGKLISETCEILPSDVNQVITLPTVQTQVLAADGATFGSKRFDIHVKNCSKDATKVGAHFEAIGSSGQNTSTGNLTNAINKTDGGAENVEIRLYNSNETPMPLGTTAAMVDITGTGVDRGATLSYFGGYYATGATTAGDVNAKVMYTLAYP